MFSFTPTTTPIDFDPFKTEDKKVRLVPIPYDPFLEWQMSKKLIVPINPLIYKVAAEMAGVFYDAGRSSGLHSKHKTPESFAKANIEKFIAQAVKTLISMLKPNSGITEHMRNEIYSALMDPVNDPNLMKAKVNTDLNFELLEEQRKFNKLKILNPIETKKTVLHK